MGNEKKTLRRENCFYGLAQMFAPAPAPAPSQTKRKRLPSESTQSPPPVKKSRIEVAIPLVPNGESQEEPSPFALGSEGSLFPIASKKEFKESISPSIQNENLPPNPGKH